MNVTSTKSGFRSGNSRRTANGATIAAAILTLIAIVPIARATDFDPSTVSGTVTDAAGHPIVGAHVWINNFEGEVDPAQLEAHAWETKTDKNGEYAITLRHTKGAPLVIKLMIVEAPEYVRGWREDRITLEGNKSATVDFHLDKGEVIAGVLRLPPAEVTAWSPKERTIQIEGPGVSKMPINATLHGTDAEGKFEFFVPHGEYTLIDLLYDTDDGKPQQWKGIKSGQRGLELIVPSFEWKPENVGKTFDELWGVMDNQYSYFFLKKDVDWKALHDKYRPAAAKAKNAEELAAVLKDMLAPLNDLHVWIDSPTGEIGTSKSGGYIYNGNQNVTLAQLVDRVQCGKFAVVGKTKQDGFGYFLMRRQSEASEANVKMAADAIRKLRDVTGFVVDLRNANGGSEPLAQEIAQLFCAKETVYAKSKRRNGPAHDAFGQINDRLVPATSDAYTKPVVCLIGPGAVSSGEGFVKMMMCLPNVTTVGMPTRGASGNPNAMPLGRTGLTVYYSSWVDMLPTGQTFEGVGIAPQIKVDLPRTAYAGADPTLEKGLEVLRSKLKGR